MSAAGARVARDTALAIRVRVDGAPEKTLARLTAVLDSLGYGPEATDYQAVSTKPRYLRGAGLWRLEASVVAAPAGSTLVITGEVRKLHRIALIFSAAGPPLPLGNDPRSELVWAKIREVADLVVQ